ncbi:MAG: hypothetical protein ACK452_09475, partial [Bacteroidota bacterium]
TLLSAAGLTFYFFPANNLSDQIDNLLKDGKIDEAYTLIESEQSYKENPTDYYFSKLKIQSKDKNSSLSDAFFSINQIGDSLEQSQLVDFNAFFLEDLRSKIQVNSSTEIAKALSNLKRISLNGWYNQFLFDELRNRALKEQTVTAWNNCIMMCPKTSDVNDFTNKRRKIFLDTALIRLSGISIDSVVRRNPCYIPILTKMDRVYNRAFTIDELYNPQFSKDNYLAGRYIVGDFNSTDANGNCRGSNDIFADNLGLDEFKDFFKELKKSNINEKDSLAVTNWFKALPEERKKEYSTAMWMWKNYNEKVDKFRTNPLFRDPVITIGGSEYCIGQRMCLCEIKNDTIQMVAQFVTSSRNVNLYHGPLQDYDCQPRYYAPMCIITSRCWDNRLRYDSLDMKRDMLMGGGARHVIRYEGKVDLPNFMNMTPNVDYPGSEVFCNGIHEFAVGGKTPGLYMGTPISLGCVRLHSYPSRFVRWWTPNKARFFITYQYKNYIQKYKSKLLAKK